MIVKLLSFVISFADFLRGLEEVSKELHPPFHGDQFILLLQPVQFDSESMYIPVHKPILRLHGHGHHFAQLRLPRHDRNYRRSRVSRIIVNQTRFPHRPIVSLFQVYFFSHIHG